MMKHTSWLFAACLVAGNAVYAQEKPPGKMPVREQQTPAPPVIVKGSEATAKPTLQNHQKATPSAQAKPKPVARVKMSDLKPATRAKVEKGEELTPAEKAEVKTAVRPAGAEPPPLPPAPKKKFSPPVIKENAPPLPPPAPRKVKKSELPQAPPPPPPPPGKQF